MNSVKISKTHCTYIIVSASTVDELEKKVNEIIEQGWQAEGLSSGGWQVTGGVTFDGRNYLQSMMNCPKSIDTAS